MRIQRDGLSLCAFRAFRDFRAGAVLEASWSGRAAQARKGGGLGRATQDSQVILSRPTRRTRNSRAIRYDRPPQTTGASPLDLHTDPDEDRCGFDLRGFKMGSPSGSWDPKWTCEGPHRTQKDLARSISTDRWQLRLTAIHPGPIGMRTRGRSVLDNTDNTDNKRTTTQHRIPDQTRLCARVRMAIPRRFPQWR